MINGNGKLKDVNYANTFTKGVNSLIKTKLISISWMKNFHLSSLSSEDNDIKKGRICCLCVNLRLKQLNA